VIVRICGVAVIGICTYAVLSHLNSGISFALKIVITALIAAYALMLLEPIPEKIYALASIGKLEGEYVSILLRGVGITVLGQITADICRDCGDTGSANGVELIAKLEIVLLCLPLLDKIIECALKILEL
jgi:stage III sporulation protein AD